LRVSARDALQGAPAVEPHRDAAGATGRRSCPRLPFTDLSSLAYKLALVAARRFDGLISRRASHDWDLAAAQLLIAEAGGRLTAADAAALVLNRPEPRHSGFAAPGDDRLRRALLERLATG
jgi:myo-inositol-1(or 4)-monophosphatase